MIRQFAFHDGVADKPTPCKMFDLYDKWLKGEALTRIEKDYIANALYGTFGSHDASYKYLGWLAPFHQVLNKYLVKKRDYGWHEYYACDKTSLRKALRGVIEIIQR